MDPNANLIELLGLAHAIVNDDEQNSYCGVQERDRMAELIIALDERIMKGGFLPTRWTGANRAY